MRAASRSLDITSCTCEAALGIWSRFLPIRFGKFLYKYTHTHADKSSEWTALLDIVLCQFYCAHIHQRKHSATGSLCQMRWHDFCEWLVKQPRRTSHAKLHSQDKIFGGKTTQQQRISGTTNTWSALQHQCVSVSSVQQVHAQTHIYPAIDNLTHNLTHSHLSGIYMTMRHNQSAQW